MLKPTFLADVTDPAAMHVTSTMPPCVRQKESPLRPAEGYASHQKLTGQIRQDA